MPTYACEFLLPKFRSRRIHGGSHKEHSLDTGSSTCLVDLDGPWPHVMHVMRFAASRQMHATVRQAPGTSGTGGFAVTGAERTLR